MSSIYAQNQDNLHPTVLALRDLANAVTANQAESYGESSYLSSMGSSNLMNSQAYINYQEGDSMYMSNRIKYVNTYFQRRQLNTYYRHLEEIQKRELIKMKRDDQYTIENLNSLFNSPSIPNY